MHALRGRSDMQKCPQNMFYQQRSPLCSNTATLHPAAACVRHHALLRAAWLQLMLRHSPSSSVLILSRADVLVVLAGRRRRKRGFKARSEPRVGSREAPSERQNEKRVNPTPWARARAVSGSEEVATTCSDHAFAHTIESASVTEDTGITIRPQYNDI